jgi:hypothetical protein
VTCRSSTTTKQSNRKWLKFSILCEAILALKRNNLRRRAPQTPAGTIHGWLDHPRARFRRSMRRLSFSSSRAAHPAKKPRFRQISAGVAVLKLPAKTSSQRWCHRPSLPPNGGRRGDRAGILNASPSAIDLDGAISCMEHAPRMTSRCFVRAHARWYRRRVGVAKFVASRRPRPMSLPLDRAAREMWSRPPPWWSH